MAADINGDFDSGREQLLRALAEQLKLPLLHIAQAVELARSGGQPDLDHIETAAEMALRLTDSYVLSGQLSQGQLSMEPVSVASVLYAAGEKLEKIAREYSCELELDVAGRYGPVMAHREGLEAAVTALGYSFIEAQQQDSVEKPRLVLAAHRSRHGIVAGAYGAQGGLTSDMFRRAKLLSGKARRPLPTFGHSPSAGIFVADSLLAAMDSQLKVARHSKLIGLAATLSPSAQLRLTEA